MAVLQPLLNKKPDFTLRFQCLTERLIPWNLLHGLFPKGTFKTATTDRGGEFACFDAIKKDPGLILYFADPYCPRISAAATNTVTDC